MVLDGVNEVCDERDDSEEDDDDDGNGDVFLHHGGDGCVPSSAEVE